MKGSSAAILGIAALATCSAQAQNHFSFTRAGESTVDYSEPGVFAETDCGIFSHRTTSDFTVLKAQAHPATESVPAHCRIDAVIAPEIRIQVNLPTAWNGRLYMHGNGAYAGTPPEAPARQAARDAALAHHFATAYTNTGHDARAEPLASFAYNNLQKEIDYAYRSMHLTIVQAKALAAEFYGQDAAYTYWDGCSTGGRQGLILAQRFPEDVDGVVAGAPVLDLTGTQTWGLWNERALRDSGIMPDHVRSLGEAIYAKCDAADGLEDGLIRDPRDCDFDIRRDMPQCSAIADSSCLTDAQVEALGKIYGGVVSNGETIFPGLPVGAEPGGWVPWLFNHESPSVQYTFGETFMRYIAFPTDDPAFTGTDFDFDRDPARMAEAAELMNADDPDLRRFRDRGGKIISYFGWADAGLNPMMGVNYYESVQAELGNEATRDFFRLYMVPGMFHCRGGFGVDRIDALTPLIDWVERGDTPEALTGTRVEDGEEVRSRPVCPYPEVSEYSGSGSVDEADSFRCVDR